MEDNSEKKFSVWISWCHNTGPQHVDALKEALKKTASVGIDVFSSRSMKEDKISDEIKKLIQKSEAYVLLISKRFPESPYINEELREISFATQCDSTRRIFPLLVEDCDLSNVGHINHDFLIKTFKEIHLDSLGDAKSPQYDNVREPLTYESMAVKILKHYGIKPRSKEDNPLFEFEAAIRKGAFVPYIGPDCYGLRDEWHPHLPTLGARLGNISKKLGEDNKSGNLEADREYLKAVVMSHNPDIDMQEQLHNGTVVGEGSVGDLFDLRVAVALAGAAASRLLGKSLCHCKGLIDAKVYQVVITEIDDDVQILQDALLAAKKHAGKCEPSDFCPMLGGHGKDCMGPHHIVEKLDLFLGAVFKKQESEAAVREVHLSLAQLDWLGDLLWHLMRFDLPIFPKPDELAFLLGLCQNTKYFARIPFGTTAAIWAATDNCEGSEAAPPVDIRNCSENMHITLADLKRSNPTKFYRAIAKLLWNSYRLSRAGQPSDEEATYESSDESNDCFYPIVVSMNFDEEIENCLEGTDYSVLFPMKLPGAHKTNWLLRVREEGEDNYYMFPEGEDNGSIERTLRGPLIVKYRGSPLHNVDLGRIKRMHGAFNSAKVKAAKPRLLLSSIDFMQELSGEDKGEPKWLRAQLDDVERSKCFLGYPLDDIDGILGIQRGVWVTSGAGNKERLSIGCRHRDGLDSELLTGLRVKPLKVELNDFADAVNKFQEFEELPQKGDQNARKR